MENILRFLSGDVPLGFMFYFSIVLALLFIYWFVDRYSPVVHRQKFRVFMFSIIGLIAVTYTFMRLARPPKPRTTHIGILPLQTTLHSPGDSVVLGLCWAIPEMTVNAGELQAPDHVVFLRPEWLTDSYGADTTGRRILKDDRERLAWSRLVGLEYLVSGTLEAQKESVLITMRVQDPFENETVVTSSTTVPRTSSGRLDSSVMESAAELCRQLLETADADPRANENGLDLYTTLAATDYFVGRFLLSERKMEQALGHFQKALQVDSLSPLGWYGTGLAHGELMIASEDDAERRTHQNRMEYFLKMAIQKNDRFQPPYSALVRYYLLSRPEPRYLDAELTMMMANDLYPRDYELFYNLSFMNKMRWESFHLGSKDAILLKALELNPAGFDAYLELGRFYIQKSRPHDHWSQLALDNFRMAHQLQPNDLGAILGLVTAYDFMSYYKEALDLLHTTLQAHPANAELQYSLGVVQYHLAAVHGAKERKKEQSVELAKAEAAFRRAVELSNHGYAHLYLGKIYDSQNKRNEAIEEFRTCMKLLKKDDPYREEARKKLREYFPDVE